MCLDDLLHDLINSLDGGLPKGIDSSTRNIAEVDSSTDSVSDILGATEPLVGFEKSAAGDCKGMNYSIEEQIALTFLAR